MDRQNMILIGFMGAGKTSVGEELAGRFGKTLIDTDRMIEERAGMSISDIFAVQGEEAFRRLETEVLEQLISEASGEMISVGGGLPLREENRKLLKKLGTIIYLRVRPETVLARLKGDTTRPLLQGDDVEEKVNSLLSKRGPIYEMAADRIISVDGRSVEQIADAIIEKR
ncbi:MAG: shikimate kinase [Hungatella hathewayi]|nr:shikimate kinase [Hungatella hathewayi]